MAGIENFRASSLDQIEEVNVGDFVRSYDFEHTDAYYMLGRVQKVGVQMEGCPRYEIAVLKHVAGDQEYGPDERPRTILPPVNGTPHSFGGYCNGVRKLEGEELERWQERWADWASDVEFD